MNKKIKNSFWHVWAIPTLLAVVSLFGLISALVGDDFLDLLSWITLTIPLAVITWFVVIAFKKNGKRRTTAK
ncbi:hypothetical protein [Spirosoma endophyticum]|uniref:hypothetical protein n=1 Tax=Spirosoma endophyticum TaxID=662367 RepID=UPI001C43179A|nr:hypothetical protein [Spirosoma endophyticum]